MARSSPQELPQSAVDRIAQNIRSMVDDRVERGVELSRGMHCDSCGLEKSSAGSSLYGPYKLCNDCLFDLTVALASGRADTVVDFMTREMESSELPPVALTDGRERSTLSRPLVHGRDKLRPSNEPA